MLFAYRPKKYKFNCPDCKTKTDVLGVAEAHMKVKGHLINLT